MNTLTGSKATPCLAQFDCRLTAISKRLPEIDPGFFTSGLGEVGAPLIANFFQLQVLDLRALARRVVEASGFRFQDDRSIVHKIGMRFLVKDPRETQRAVD